MNTFQKISRSLATRTWGPYLLVVVAFALYATVAILASK
jgi:hypothetical protein